MVHSYHPSLPNDPDGGPPRTEGAPVLEDVWNQFYAYCFAIISGCPGVRRLSVTDREDCVQDVMMEIIRRFDAAQAENRPEHFDAWVRTVSRNKAADLVRRRIRKPETGFDDGSGETLLDPTDAQTDASQPEYVALVWEALLSLDQQVSATSYLVFYLRSIEGWDVPEIAELFQLSTEQTRARCHRVKKKFESILKTRGGDVGT